MATYLPSKEADLFNWLANFEGLVTADFAQYGITQPQSLSLTGLFDNYRAAYETAIEPSTRTRPAVAAKNTSRDALVLEVRRLVSIIDGQANVSDAQRLALGLKVRDIESTPVPRPATAPMIEIVSTVGNTATIRLFDSNGRRRKPDGVIGATVFSFVGANAPSEESAWKFEGNLSKTTEVVAFAQSLPPGTKVWFTAFWYNRRAESGPPATPVSTNLPGGSAMAQAA